MLDNVQSVVHRVRTGLRVQNLVELIGLEERGINPHIPLQTPEDLYECIYAFYRPRKLATGLIILLEDDDTLKKVYVASGLTPETCTFDHSTATYLFSGERLIYVHNHDQYFYHTMPRQVMMDTELRNQVFPTDEDLEFTADFVDEAGATEIDSYLIGAVGTARYLPADEVHVDAYLPNIPEQKVVDFLLALKMFLMEEGVWTATS